MKIKQVNLLRIPKVVFIVWIAFTLLKQKRNLNYIKNFVKIKSFSIVMPSENTKLIDFNQCQKSDKALFIIYADIGCLIHTIVGFKNNSENSSTTKEGEHIPSGFSMSTISLLKCI